MKSLLKAIDTIEAVAEAGSAGIRELSTITGYPPSTIHRIAATLVERHYFQQDSATKQYSLSFRFLELGTKVQLKIHLASVARPHIESLMIVLQPFPANLDLTPSNKVNSKTE